MSATPPTELLRRARVATWLHPRWLLALKTALAAGLAWLLVQPVGGDLGQYHYYAPMGAAVAMSTTVVGSVRTSLQTIVAIAIGAAIATGVGALDAPGWLALGLTIAVATLIAGLHLLGSMGGWVLVAALFVLVIGGRDPGAYVAAYLGLTAFGALVATAVNALLPQLPLAPVARAQARLRHRLAAELDGLAEALLGEDVVHESTWEEQRRRLEPHLTSLRELVAEADDARRANWRAGRWSQTADRRYTQARALERLAGCVDEVSVLVSDQRSAVHADEESARELRETMARAMRAVATMLRSADEDPVEEDADDAPTVDAERTVAELGLLVARLASLDDKHLPAAAVWVNLERAVEAWA
ncbi:aromatic acid exporter family protein [Nocardioides marmotae]|uniref:aromatic acid exporter family protein n=1 Tax=Nocardioides marmotae TaxID=2663857 RepID=UPI0012B5C7EC|nr:aromatic acid exporter family protein [Nocardioides marmotae]MBC9733280.1 hypothetical protein [Nocardioides marmotae]MTB84390.1 hypothetical protein [Nocardioides marmotae]